MKRCHQSVWTHDDGTFRKLVIILFHTLQVVSRRVRLSDGTRRQVHDLVPIPSDVGVQLCHAEVRPVPPDHRENMTKTIGSTCTLSNVDAQRSKASALGYRAVDIRNDDMVCRIPNKYPCCAPRGAGRRERKRDRIRTGFQVQGFLT